jgi:hypothetical protein
MAGETAQLVWRITKRLLIALFLFFLLVALWFLVGAVSSRLIRLAVAATMSLGIAWLGIGYFSQLGNPPPPDAPPTDVHPGLRLAYLCEMCGLELAVVKVSKDRAPRHCGEPMTLTRRGEAP